MPNLDSAPLMIPAGIATYCIDIVLDTNLEVSQKVDGHALVWPDEGRRAVRPTKTDAILV